MIKAKIIAGILTIIVSNSAEPQSAAGLQTIRIDEKLTLENSIVINFGKIKKMRVPKVIFSPALINESGPGPWNTQAISMTFTYPDMTPVGWKSSMDRIFEKARKVYAPTPDRFPVQIVWMFYSPDEKNAPPDYGLLDPRPAQIERNRNCLDQEATVGCISSMVQIPSGLKGIDAQVSKEWLDKNPGGRFHNVRKGGRYVAKAGAPYDLALFCSAQDGDECLGFVYSYRHQFQYRIKYPPEAVAHTHDLLVKIEDMLTTWLRLTTR